MFLHFDFSRCLQALLYCVVFMQPGESEWCILLMSCCSNRCCPTSVKLLASTCEQEYWTAAAQDSGLHTRHVASQQTRPQSCRLGQHYTDSHSGMHLSETARDVKHRRWAVFINRMTYYISQGRVETPIRRGGPFCCNFVANLLQYLCAKIIKIQCGFTKLLQK